MAVEIYKTTKKFPKEETYSLTDQMRRATISVTSNVAEGFGRQTYKEKIQFYYVASGSLTELKNQIILAKDVSYLSQNDFAILMELSDNVHRLLNPRKTPQSEHFLII